MVCLLTDLPEVQAQLDKYTNILGSEDAAYYVLSENNGYELDKAPNGLPSKLFSDLLSYYNGDETQAIRAKAKLFTESFRNWFGDWLSDDKTNVSKVVDENGEPLMVYHGGAKDITEFRISSEEGNTDRGYYTDKATGEKIPVDSARSIFFSDNKYVGVSYGTLLAIQTYLSLLYRVNSLLYTVRDNKAGIDSGVFKTFDYFYDTLTALTEFNPRFERLREYIKSIKKQGKRLNPKEIQAFRELLLETRKELEKVSSDYLMNRPDWEDALDVANKVIKQYSTEEGVKKLKQGEIPKLILKEWELYKKIEKLREKYEMPKIANYETLHLSLSRNGRYYMVYDGDKIRLWTPDYSDPYIEDLTEEQIKDFLDEALQVNEANIETLANEEEYSKLRQHYQLYPVFLNIKSPLVHDYEGTHQGQGYKQSPTISFGYIAARLVNKAIKDGNDGVVFENIYDPILANNYAVFDPNLIKSIDNRGTFSTQNNNIYYNLSGEPDIRDLIISNCKGLLHKYGEGKLLYLNKSKGFNHITKKVIEKSEEELISTLRLANRLVNQLGYELVPVVSKNLTSRLLIRPLYLRDEIALSNLGDSALEVTEVLTFLTDRFPGLKFKIVPADGVEDRVNAWIDNDTIYLVEGRFNKDIAIEEAIHPFINTLFHTNRELFSSLYSEISLKYPKLRADIERRYADKDVDTREQELVALAFSRAFNELFSNNEPSKLREVLRRFIDWLRNLFTTDVISTYGDINYVDTTKLPKMTLDELVRIVHTNDTVFDVMYEGLFNSLSELLVLEINKTYERILKGLKDRLKSVKRYSTKNPRLWNQLSTVISQLANSEAELGTLLFLLHISDTISDAVKFLLKPIDEINAKLIRQLSQDYVGFYKPLLDDIMYLFDTTDIFKDLPNYPELLRNALRLSTEMDLVYNRFVHLLKAKGISELVNYLLSNNVPQSYIDKTLEWLNNPTNDISIFINWFGMASNSNSMVTLAIAKMLNDTMNLTLRETMSKGIELVKLALVAKEKYGTDVQKLLYEKLNDGTYSGYRVRPINHGQYRKDKQEYLDKLANKLGITKDKEGHYNLPNDEAIQKKWFDGINKFYSERVNRRFTSEYYTTRNRMLSIKTREAIDEILDYIDSIVSRVTRDDIQHDEELTASEYLQLLMLRRLKLLLANRYNLDGSIKTGDDLLIANELTAFNEEVNKNVSRTEDWDRYNKDYKAIVKQYGSKDDPRVKLWVYRNTKLRYTLEFYDRLDKLNKAPLTDLYNELVLRRRELTLLFKDPETNQIDPDMLSDELRAMLLQLDKDIEAARTYSSKEEDSDSFGSFAEVVYTLKYYDDARAAQQAGTALYNQWYELNHYEDLRGYMKPARYYTVLKPKDSVAEKYTETVPTGRYTKIDPTSNWYNPDYDTNGPAILPKKEYYDNSLAYNEVMSKPEVKELYEAIVLTMNEANFYIPFLNMADDGRMSLMPARFALVWARMSGITDRLKYAVDEVVTTLADDFDYVEEFATMPNGDPIKVIPTRFILMLENPNTISTDAVTATIAYYNMAVNFKNMLEHLDNIELMLGLLKGITIRNRKGTVLPGNSNLYKQALLLVDRLMYGKNMNLVTANIFGKEINITKMATMLLNLIRKVNLSGNIWSIGTSFFTDSTYTTLEAKLGRYFDKEDLQFATKEYVRRLPNIMENIGNPVPNDKLSYLMLLNQVVRDNKEVFNRIDLSLVLRSINNNFWYLGYTQSDYLVKSHTLISVYHNYRLVDGKFMSKAEFINKYYPNDKKAGEIAFKLLLVTAFDAYNEDGTIKEEYKDKITTKLLNDIKNRIDVLSRRIDGTLREVDKAQIHANFLGLYIVMHKNFMILGLHDRFKKKLFNLDTGVEEEGYYRSMARFLRNIVGNRHFGLTLLLADYNLLQEYELYAVRRVLHEMALFTSATLLAVSLASLVDGDDDYDNWLMQSVTYLALRSAFEFRTMYNPMEFLSMIKSPTAAFTWFDNASAFINLFNPFSYIGSGGPFEIIDRGVYKGMPRILRNIIKVTPIRSIIEAGDPESKRSYLLNQLMSF